MTDTKWQIQARNKDYGTEWEPVSIDAPIRLGDGSPQRRFHYDSEISASLELERFLDRADGLPNLVVRLATGRARFLDRYDVRIVEVGHQIKPISGAVPQFARFFKEKSKD